MVILVLVVLWASSVLVFVYVLDVCVERKSVAEVVCG